MHLSTETGVAVTPERARVRALLEQWDMSSVKRYAVKHGYCAEADVDRLEQAYKDFMADAITSPTDIEVYDEVDPLWHTHLLFTQDYMRMCYTIANRYMHHVPMSAASPCQFDTCGCKGGSGPAD